MATFMSSQEFSKVWHSYKPHHHSHAFSSPSVALLLFLYMATVIEVEQGISKRGDYRGQRTSVPLGPWVPDVAVDAFVAPNAVVVFCSDNALSIYKLMKWKDGL
jgi:hypothetical protein